MSLSKIIFFTAAAVIALAGLYAWFRARKKACARRLARQDREVKQLNRYLACVEAWERKALASKLHATLAQTLGMGVSRIKTLIESGPEFDPGELAGIQAVLEQGVKEVRTLIQDLSPPVLDDFDMDVAVDFLMEEINEKNKVFFVFSNGTDSPAPLDRAVKLTLYRAVKTILANILKFCPAPDARVKIYISGRYFCIRIKTRGLTFDQAVASGGKPPGYPGMAERIQGLGGNLAGEPGPDRGLVLTLTAPLASETEPAAPAGPRE